MPQKTVIYKPQTDVPTKFNTRFKEFPDFVKCTCWNRPIYNPDGVELYKSKYQLNSEERQKEWKNKQKQEDEETQADLRSFGWLGENEKAVVLRSFEELNENDKSDDGVSRSDSIKRAKDKAFEIAYANDFEYFITLSYEILRRSICNFE